jgi:hypothetical protein
MQRELKPLPELQLVYAGPGDTSFDEEQEVWVERPDDRVGYREYGLGQTSACVLLDPLDGKINGGRRWLDTITCLATHPEELAEEIAQDTHNPGEIGLRFQQVFSIENDGEFRFFAQENPREPRDIETHAMPLWIYPAQPGSRIGYYSINGQTISVCALIYIPCGGDLWVYVCDLPPGATMPALDSAEQHRRLIDQLQESIKLEDQALARDRRLDSELIMHNVARFMEQIVALRKWLRDYEDALTPLQRSIANSPSESAWREGFEQHA